MYTKSDLEKNIQVLFRECAGNAVLVPGAGTIQLYEMPLFGTASADDELFLKYKDEKVIGKLFMTPEEWLPGAKSVISLFFHFSGIVCRTNWEERLKPSIEWAYARFEGQKYLDGFISGLRKKLEEQGIRVCVPSLDERFGIVKEPVEERYGEDFHVDSRWSERHAAYACGLGTFGLSRGLITAKGMAGRFVSLIIDAEVESTKRDYEGVYDYCIRCGACVKNCPASAITLEYGKNNLRCDRYVSAMKKLFAPRYGCGKCQVSVPCENANPLKLK